MRSLFWVLAFASTVLVYCTMGPKVIVSPPPEAPVVYQSVPVPTPEPAPSQPELSQPLPAPAPSQPEVPARERKVIKPHVKQPEAPAREYPAPRARRSKPAVDQPDTPRAPSRSLHVKAEGAVPCDTVRYYAKKYDPKTLERMAALYHPTDAQRKAALDCLKE